MGAYMPSKCASDIDQLPAQLSAAFVALYVAGIRSRELYSSILQESLVANPRLLSTWTVWEPDAFDGRDAEFVNTEGHDGTGRFVTCWHRAAGHIERVPVIGYHSPGEGDWYWMPKRRLTACQLAPMDYQFGTHAVRITSRISPLVIDGRFHGAVGIDLSASPALDGDGTQQKHRATTSPLLESKLSVLSPREREVVHWLGQGKSNDEIATILGISSHTVKNHLDHIFQKLGVHNRYEAILATT